MASDPKDVAKRVLNDLVGIERYVQVSVGDTPRWPDLEALLRIASSEAARVYERESAPPIVGDVSARTWRRER